MNRVTMDNVAQWPKRPLARLTELERRCEEEMAKLDGHAEDAKIAAEELVEFCLSGFDRSLEKAASAAIVSAAPKRAPDIYQRACPLCARMAHNHGRLLSALNRAVSDFVASHPRCGACGILMGDGHVESHIAALCYTCERASTV